MKKFFKRITRTKFCRESLIILLRAYFFLLIESGLIEINFNRDLRDFLRRVKNKEGIFLFLPHTLLLEGILILGFFYSKRKFLKEPSYALISNSFEGELVSSAIKKFGIETIFGSSRKKQLDSFQEILEVNAKGLISVIVFDGPKGPPLIPKSGIEKYVREVNQRKKDSFRGFLVACKLKNRLFFQLKSWDRFVVPLPFSSLKVGVEKIESNTLKEIESKAKSLYQKEFFS